MRPIAIPLLVALLGCAGVASSAHAQRARAVSPDESVIAADALIRAGELADAGNVAESLRVYQSLLDNEGERMLGGSGDPDLYVPVRRVVHEAILARPGLLARYREQEGAKAEAMLASGDLRTLERTRLLTQAGFEASLRLAQLDLEGARFESARLMLAQLESHPDRLGDARGGADAAGLAAAVASFLGRDDVRAWAARWASQASLADVPGLPRTAGVREAIRSRSPLQPGPSIDLANLPKRALQSVPADSRAAGREDDRSARPAWVFPSVAGGLVYVNDGEGVSAWDAATLAPAWQSRIGGVVPTTSRGDSMFGLVGTQSWAEDPASVTVGSGIAVAPLGIPENGVRRGDRRVFAMDAITGRALWAVDVADLEPRLEEASVRGPAIIEEDTVVLFARKASQVRRTSALFLVGLDAYTGRQRWSALVGSVGTNPWGRTQVRPDAGVAHRGVVYRGDDMGVIGAYEIGTGRPIWVRTTNAPRGMDGSTFRAGMGVYPYEIAAPVIVGDSLFFVEPGREKVLQLSLADGSLQASRDSSALGEPRYLLLAGEHLAAIGASRVAVVKASEFSQGTIRLSPSFTSNPIRGRGIVAGGQVLLPVEGGIALIDPQDPAGGSIVAMNPGNLLVASAESDSPSTHLLVTDTALLHSYVTWEQAERLLDRRVAASPKDPRPLLTYVELLHHSGHASRVPAIADAALALLDENPTGAENRRSRATLFDLLLTMVRGARDRSDAGAGGNEPGPIRDLAIVDEVLNRLSRCAESPAEQAADALERAWVREAQGRAADAVESLQRVLLDDTLANVVPAGASGTKAGEAASASLALLLRKSGPAPYAAFDEEASLRLDDLGDAASPAAYASLARQYPCSRAAAEAWRRAAGMHARAGQRDLARRAAGSGLAAAELSASIGRPDQLGAIGLLTGELVRLASDPGDTGALFRTLSRLAAQHPGLVIPTGAGSAPVATVTSRVAGMLRAQSPFARLGSGVRGEGSVIEQWLPAPALVRHRAGVSTDSVVMVNEVAGLAGLWGIAAEDGQLRPLWTRSSKTAPTVIHVGHERTLLFWPSLQGGSVECVNLDGTTAWRTPEFSTLFPGAEGAEPHERIPTPLDGQVRPDSLVMSMNDASLALVQRSGAAAVFDVNRGTVLWSARLGVSRVYDVAHAGNAVVVAGADRGPTGELSPRVLCVDIATGASLGSVPVSTLGDHPRWVRPVPGGDAIVATSDGVVRFDPGTANVRWSATGDALAASTDGWVLPGAAFVLDSELRVWRVDLNSGTVGQKPVDVGNRLMLPVQGVVQGDRLLLASSLGVAAVLADGSLAGVDSLDATQLEPAAVGDGVVACVESPRRDFAGPDGQALPYRLLLLDNPGGRLLSVSRVRLFDTPDVVLALDGKIVIGQGVATLVFDVSPAR